MQTLRGGAEWLSSLEAQTGAFVAASDPWTFALALGLIACVVGIAVVYARWRR